MQRLRALLGHFDTVNRPRPLSPGVRATRDHEARDIRLNWIHTLDSDVEQARAREEAALAFSRAVGDLSEEAAAAKEERAAAAMQVCLPACLLACVHGAAR